MFTGDIYPGDNAFNSEEQIVYGGRSKKKGGDLTTMRVGDPAFNSLQKMVYGGLVSKAALKRAAKAWDRAHRKKKRKGKLPKGVVIGPNGKFMSLKKKRGGRIFGGSTKDLSRGILDMDEIAEESIPIYVKHMKLVEELKKAGITGIDNLILVPELRNLAKQAIELRDSWNKGRHMNLEYLKTPVFVTRPEYGGFLDTVEAYILAHEVKPTPAVLALRKYLKPGDVSLGMALKEGKDAYDYATNPFSALLNRLQGVEGRYAPPITMNSVDKTDDIDESLYNTGEDIGGSPADAFNKGQQPQYNLDNADSHSHYD